MTRRNRATCPKCIAAPDGWKHCHGRCDEAKPLGEFHNDKNSPDGKTGRCKACNNEASRLRDEADPDGKKSRNAAYWALNGHRYAYNRMTPEYSSEYQKMWRARPGNAASVQAYGQVRRARKKGAEVCEPVNREHLAEMYGWTCMMDVCLNPDGRAIDPTLAYIDPETGKPNPWYLSTEHVIQVEHLGDNSYENTRPAHLRCNISRKRGPRKDRVDPPSNSCDNRRNND